MKPKTMILMVVAVVCGLGASYMTSRLLAEREEPAAQAAPPPIEKVTLVVAKKPLPIGQMIKNAKALFNEKSFVKEDAPKDALSDVKSLEGKVLKRSLRGGDHVFPDDISDRPQTLEVPPGMRALGLSVNLASIASGFASLPGSRVDIIWTYRGPNAKETFAMKLLQNVLVLAADQQDGTPETRALPASVVTVAVTPEDAERVGLATQNGSFYLVLRRPDDNTINNEKQFTTLWEVVNPKRQQEKAEDVIPEAIEPKKDGDGPPVVEDENAKWEPIPAPQVRRHTVTRREGDRQWKEVYELPDEDDFEELPTGPQRQIAAQTPPQAQPQLEPQQNPEAQPGRAKGG
jgi:pilus assembly protein CpaB